MKDRDTASWWQLSSPQDPKTPSGEPGARSHAHMETRVLGQVLTLCTHYTVTQYTTQCVQGSLNRSIRHHHHIITFGQIYCNMEDDYGHFEIY